MPFLDDLTQTDIEKAQLPLPAILKDSCYYPASNFDGRVIKCCNTLYSDWDISSFIYCDYGVEEKDLAAKQATFLGYTVFATRNLRPIDLIPNGWNPIYPPGFNSETANLYRDPNVLPFARWIVYERKMDFSPEHGPKRFSLLYIGGEGVATYQALYWTNAHSPKVIVITDHGFGGNYTKFSDTKGPFYWVVSHNNHGMPKYIFHNQVELTWPNYHYISDCNGLTVWERKSKEQLSL